MLTNFPNGVSSFGVPQVGSGVPITFGTYYFVDADNGSDANDGLSKDTALKTVAAAYAKTVTNHDDVIVLSSNAAHTLTSMLDVSKNRVHFVGAGAPGRKYGQRARLSMGVTTAATDIGAVKVTGIGCSFTNIKFTSTNTKAESIYTVVEGGEYTIYQNCEFYKGTDLNETTASELVANGDSTQYINCTFGSLADAVSGNIIRAAVRLTKGIAGAGKVARDNYFENCLFWRRAGGTATAFVYSAADADVERLVMFNGCTFIAAANSAGTPAVAVAGAAAFTVGNIVLKDCTAVGCTKMATQTGILVSGPAVNASTGIAVNGA